MNFLPVAVIITLAFHNGMGAPMDFAEYISQVLMSQTPDQAFGRLFRQVNLLQDATCFVGLKGHVLKDDALSSSSDWDTNHASDQGRLDNQQIGHKRGAWSSKTNAVGQWIMVDLGQVTSVSGIITQGRPSSDQWVRTYKVHCGETQATLAPIQEAGKDKIFTGNKNQNDRSVQKFGHLHCRYIRIYPQSWYKHMSMRFEVIKGQCADLY
ncbi:lactadherin-like [Styela clava]|uniref:lactadherin-like n=1 Tax=Styela clava TaxID=7725 RepID=UPI00193AA597|nr:lactadherin-like [Styela clava]